MDTEPRIEAVVDLLEGRRTREDVAQSYGVSAEEVDTWRAVFLAGARASKPRRSREELVVVGLLAVFATLGAKTAWAQACTQTLPSPLATFCADSPALASTVNSNNQALVNFISQKVGPVGTGAVTVTGGLTTNTATVTGGLSANTATFAGNLVVNGTDLILSNASRGVTSGRALLHESGNLLVMNYQGDYTGGVRIDGNVTFPGNTWNGSTWLASAGKTPADGAAVLQGGDPGAGWRRFDCSDDQYMCGIAFTHPGGRTRRFRSR